MSVQLKTGHFATEELALKFVDDHWDRVIEFACTGNEDFPFSVAYAKTPVVSASVERTDSIKAKSKRASSV